jgi:hypothetical protein
LIKAGGAIGASVLPGSLDVHIASAQERHAPLTPSNSPTASSVSLASAIHDLPFLEHGGGGIHRSRRRAADPGG